MSHSSSQDYGAVDDQFLGIVAPLQRSPIRLYILWAILALWLITLVVLYFTTVRPRHRSPAEQGREILEPRAQVMLRAR